MLLYLIIEILNHSDDPIKNIEELYEEYQQCIQLEKISINVEDVMSIISQNEFMDVSKKSL